MFSARRKDNEATCRRSQNPGGGGLLHRGVLVTLCAGLVKATESKVQTIEKQTHPPTRHQSERPPTIIKALIAPPAVKSSMKYSNIQET